MVSLPSPNGSFQSSHRPSFKRALLFPARITHPKGHNHSHGTCRAHFALHSHLFIISPDTSPVGLSLVSGRGVAQNPSQLPGLLSRLALRNYGILECFGSEGALKFWFQAPATGREPSTKPEMNSQCSWVCFCPPWFCGCPGNEAEFLF